MDLSYLKGKVTIGRYRIVRACARDMTGSVIGGANYHVHAVSHTGAKMDPGDHSWEQRIVGCRQGPKHEVRRHSPTF